MRKIVIFRVQNVFYYPSNLCIIFILAQKLGVSIWYETVVGRN